MRACTLLWGEAIHRVRGWQPGRRRSAPPLFIFFPEPGAGAPPVERSRTTGGKGEEKAALRSSEVD